MSILGRLQAKVRRYIEPPPVRERVVVRHLKAAQGGALKPGFIIGVYRSGTTLLRFVLDSHEHIAVPPESNFLMGVAEVWQNEWYRRGLQGVGVDEDGLRERLRGFAGGVFDDYALAKGKERWFDKTPSYVDILEFLDAVFGGECRYIMLYRHGLDVASSMVRMHGNDVGRGPARRFADLFPDAPRLTNTHYWMVQCEKMLAFEASHPGQCFRIRYEDYSTHPEQHLPPLFEFLGEDWDPQVLKFAEKQHDFGLQDSRIAETRTFSPNIGVYKTWPAADVARATEIAGATLEKLGYSV